jgi:histidinol-phosphate/aromatic aminotransferase/cobyric acid decarboxylase-like protein
VIFSVFPQLLTRKSRILTIAPTYGEYAHAFGALCDVPDANVVQVKVDAKTFGDGSAVLEELTQLACEGERPFDFISLVNPNSPTGTLMDLRPFAEKLSEVCPNTVLWVDETYVDYAKVRPTQPKIEGGGGTKEINTNGRAGLTPPSPSPPPPPLPQASQKKGTVHSLEPLLPDCPNLLVCKSMSKSHSLSGVRAAYLAGQRCRELRRFIPPWSVSLPAQLCAIEALKDAAYYQKCYKKVAADRKAMVTALRKGGLDVVDGCANFFCLLLETESAADFVTHCQKEHGVFLRIINPTCVRVAVRSKDENARILAAIVDAAEVVAGAEGE